MSNPLPHVRDPSIPSGEVLQGQRRRLSTVPRLGIIIIDELRAMVIDVIRPPGPAQQGRRKSGVTTIWYELANKDVTFYWGSGDPWVDYLGQGEIVKRLILTGEIRDAT